MKGILRLIPVAGLVVVGVLIAIGPSLLPGATTPASASHGNFNVHVHDDFFHPTGSFVPGPGHATAEALCEQGNPDPSCTATIHVGPGDSITWVSPAPLAANVHTVTECTDGGFLTCGAAVSASNPIDDSGLRNPPNPGPSGWPYGPVTFTTPGAYFYRCEVHPTIMRGRVLVEALTTPPAGDPAVGGVAGLLDANGQPATTGAEGASDGYLMLALILGVSAISVLAGGAGSIYAWKAARRE